MCARASFLWTLSVEGRALEEVRGCNFGFSQEKRTREKNRVKGKQQRWSETQACVWVILAGILEAGRMRSEVTRRSSVCFNVKLVFVRVKRGSAGDDAQLIPVIRCHRIYYRNSPSYYKQLISV